MASVRRRQLMAELSALRESAGLSHDAAAHRLGWPAARLARIEAGRTAPHPADVRRMLAAYGVTDQGQTAALVALAAGARQHRQWYCAHTSLPDRYDLRAGLTSQASSIRAFTLGTIPGLLQTEGYARAVIRGGPQKLAASQIDARAAARMSSQQVLAGPDPARLWAIVDEAAIRRVAGGPVVMREQLARLAVASEQAGIILQVVPYGAGAHPGLAGSFLIFGFAGRSEPDIVCIEAAGGHLYLDEPADVVPYAAAFDQLRAVALSPGATRELLREAAAAR
jgi:transcriptional regulator with XRE-family HTH domain